ncbi:HD domain-containing protein [Paramagnetospirillum marisnigri]|uniref:HD domain-containing protein n=1 Tax=Paramagnetospirillum marisnigri TaxID=1285242 RepID=UPI000A404230|nr:HD domain-containing protein [Paramagnetospirillum marisnigri]
MMPDSPWSQDSFLTTLAFAAERHGDQKTPTGFPYVTHLASVAQEVMAALATEPGRNGTLAVTTALLHDVIEDTATSPEMVAERFGPDILAAVTVTGRLMRLTLFSALSSNQGSGWRSCWGYILVSASATSSPCVGISIKMVRLFSPSQKRLSL